MAKSKTNHTPIKVVYVDPENHNQFDVTDSKPESRNVPGTDRKAHAVAPSSYDRTAVNFDVTQDFLDDHPEFKDTLAVGDIVDHREINAALGVEKDNEDPDPKDRDDKLPVDDDINKTDEELNQDK